MSIHCPRQSQVTPYPSQHCTSALHVCVSSSYLGTQQRNPRTGSKRHRATLRWGRKWVKVWAELFVAATAGVRRKSERVGGVHRRYPIQQGNRARSEKSKPGSWGWSQNRSIWGMEKAVSWEQPQPVCTEHSLCAVHPLRCSAFTTLSNPPNSGEPELPGPSYSGDARSRLCPLSGLKLGVV